MASPSVHVKDGKKCSECGKEFNKSSMTLSIRKKEPGFITRRICCGECYETHYRKGE